MGVQQPGKAPGPSAQQIERQLQLTVNGALKVLDASTPVNPANQAEVDSLRSLIWSELTGLEAEFAREGGPRADRVERFFHHLLSSGDYIGQIESLGSALLGGEPLPTQPAAGSPVAGLHQLHGSLTSVRQQWQQVAVASRAQPAGPTRPATVSRPVAQASGAALGSNSHMKKGSFVEQAAQVLPDSSEEDDELAGRERRLSKPRAQAQQARKTNRVERLFTDLGLGSFNESPALPLSEAEPPRPRAIIIFIAVIILLALFGVGVIYIGLTSGPQPGTGTVYISTQTVTIPTVVQGTPSATPTLSPLAPQLVLQGDNLQVPCASSKQSTGFILQNSGGQILTWSAKVNPVAGISPVSLSVSSGQLYGSAGTNTKVVTVTAQINSGVAGTITITSNGGTQTLHYQIIGC